MVIVQSHANRKTVFFFMIDVLVVGILNTWFAPFIHLFIDLNIEYFLFSS